MANSSYTSTRTSNRSTNNVISSSSQAVASSSTNASSSSSSSSNSFNANFIQMDTLIKTNPFLDDFIDCIQNLPNKLQILLTELRNVDNSVKGFKYVYLKFYFLIKLNFP